MLTEPRLPQQISAAHDLETGMESIPGERVLPGQTRPRVIESLLDSGITTIPTPCRLRQKLTESENSYNCPIVAPPRSSATWSACRNWARFISPSVNFGNREYLPAHLSKTFSTATTSPSMRWRPR